MLWCAKFNNRTCKQELGIQYIILQMMIHTQTAKDRCTLLTSLKIRRASLELFSHIQIHINTHTYKYMHITYPCYITFVYRVRGLHNAVISLVGKGLVGQKLGLTTDVAQKQYSEARVGETAFDWQTRSAVNSQCCLVTCPWSWAQDSPILLTFNFQAKLFLSVRP